MKEEHESLNLILRRREMPSVEQLSQLACSLRGESIKKKVKDALEIWREAGDLLEEEKGNFRDIYDPESAERLEKDIEKEERIFKGENIISFDTFLERVFDNVVNEGHHLEAFKAFKVSKCANEDHNCNECKETIEKLQEKGVNGLDYISYYDLREWGEKWEAERQREEKEYEKPLNTTQVKQLVSRVAKSDLGIDYAVMVALLAGSDGMPSLVYKELLRGSIKDLEEAYEERDGVFRKVSVKAVKLAYELDGAENYKGNIGNGVSDFNSRIKPCVKLEGLIGDGVFITERLIGALSD